MKEKNNNKKIITFSLLAFLIPFLLMSTSGIILESIYEESEEENAIIEGSIQNVNPDTIEVTCVHNSICERNGDPVIFQIKKKKLKNYKKNETIYFIVKEKEAIETLSKEEKQDRREFGISLITSAFPLSIVILWLVVSMLLVMRDEKYTKIQSILTFSSITIGFILIAATTIELVAYIGIGLIVLPIIGNILYFNRKKKKDGKKKST